MTSPPTSKRVRLTISVPENVHQAYRYMSDVTGRSIGMEMGEWLDATLLAAVHMTERMSAARDAPRQAVQKINDLTAALESVERVRRASTSEEFGLAASDGKRSAAVSARPIPPPSNTGGKPPKQHQRASRSK